MCRNYLGILLEINWYFYAHFYATQTKSSLTQTEKQEITKWQKEIHFYPMLISSQDAILSEYKSFRK